MTNDGRPVECASLLRGDLDDILRLTSGWEELRGQRLFVTGGTGFFGTWLLHSLAWANAQLGLGASVVVLTRDAAAFRARVPDLADNPAIDTTK
jgi:dTDP-glucose 4,6-dehydratase